MKRETDFREWISSKINIRFLILFATFFILFLLFKKIVLLLLLLAFVMIFEGVIHYIHFPIHIDFAPFLSLFITREYGFGISIAFVLISGILPELVVGHFDITDSLSTFIVVIINVLFAGMLANSFLPAAYFAVFLFFGIQIAVAFLVAAPPQKIFIEPIIVLALNLLLIYRISPVLFFISQ